MESKDSSVWGANGVNGNPYPRMGSQNLFLFAHNCTMPAELHSSQTNSLASFNEKAHQDTIIGRLDPYLHEKWHVY